jgi:hypothetical protein
MNDAEKKAIAEPQFSFTLATYKECELRELQNN